MAELGEENKISGVFGGVQFSGEDNKQGLLEMTNCL